MVSLIRDDNRFTNQMFKDGVSKTDVAHMREAADAAALGRKKRKRKITCQTPTEGVADAESVASLVQGKIRGKLPGWKARLTIFVIIWISCKRSWRSTFQTTPLTWSSFSPVFRGFLDSIGHLPTDPYQPAREGTPTNTPGAMLLMASIKRVLIFLATSRCVKHHKLCRRQCPGDIRRQQHQGICFVILFSSSRMFKFNIFIANFVNVGKHLHHFLIHVHIRNWMGGCWSRKWGLCTDPSL